MHLIGDAKIELGLWPARVLLRLLERNPRALQAALAATIRAIDDGFAELEAQLEREESK